MAEEHEEWMPYQKMEAGILKDISCDTDEILKKLEGVKMGEGFDTGALMGMLANKGIDPGVVAMLNDRCRDGNWNEGGGIWIVLLFLFLLGIGGGNGFFGRNGFAGDAGVAGVDRTVVNEANYSRLLDAIGTQGTRQEMAMQGLDRPSTATLVRSSPLSAASTSSSQSTKARSSTRSSPAAATFRERSRSTAARRTATSSVRHVRPGRTSRMYVS